MENDRLINKAGWLKYSLLCLLSCPLSVTAAIDSKTAETPLAITNLTNRDVETQNNLLEIQQNSRKRTLTGTVVDEADGTPIVGANIIIKGSKTGVITDLDGRFSIPINEKGGTLEISYIGYKKQNVYITDQGFINVKLASDNEMLSEVVIVGAGTQKKVSVTGAITSVKGATLKAPSSSLTNSIAGKLAGVVSTTSSGEPGSTSSFYIRGISTFGGVSTPLILLDGVEISSGDLDRIPSESIESFSILKDASATAIYGARGANGVIIITTKSGKEGKVQVDFGASYGFKKVTKLNKVMSPYDYVAYQYETGRTEEYGLFEDMDIWKTMEGTDYQDEIFGRTGNQAQYNLNVSGGSKQLKYNISYAHNDEKSIMLGSGFNKDNVNAKINSELNKWLSLDFNVRMSYSTLDGLSGGADTNESNAANSIVANATRFRPVNPMTYDASDDEANNAYTTKNPLERLLGVYKKKTTFNQNYNAGVNWKPFKNFTFRSEFGYGWKYEDTDQVWNADGAQNSKLGYNGQPQAVFTRVTTKNWRNANTLTYDNKKLFGGRDRINVLLGHEVSSNEKKTLENTSVAFPTSMSIEEVLSTAGAGTALPNQTTLAAKENLLSFFGRANYTLMDKYLLTVTVRADGSSKFAKGNQWGVFPSAALAWRISDEQFMQNTRNWLSSLKLRLSYGTAGNNRINSGLTYTAYSLSSNTARAPFFNGDRTSMMELGSYLYNPKLKWETTVTRNFGIDYGFWNNRLSGSIDLYWNTTNDLLMKTEIPANAGYNYQYQNFGSTSNKGVELSMNAIIADKKKFGLNFNFNISYNRNRIEKLNTDNPWQSSGWGGSTIAKYEDFRVEEGGRLGEIWGYKTNGFYTAYDPVTNPEGELILNGTNWVLKDGLKDNSVNITGGSYFPGGLKVECDENGEPIKQKLGNTVAPVYGGFGFNGRAGNFDFTLFFNFSIGNKIVNATKLATSFFAGTSYGYNLNEDFCSGKRYTWIDPTTGYNLGKSISSDALAYYGGEAGIISRLNQINANASIYNPVAVTQMQLTDYAVENASFLRVNNITIGYSLPKSWIRKCYMQNVRIYVTGYNLFCLTNYSGTDPEVDTSSKRNPMTPGIDYAAYPKSRSFVGGINVTF